MKKKKIDFKNLNILQVAIIIISIGFIIGILFANFFKDFYFNQMLEYNRNLFNKLSQININRKILFEFIIIDKLKKYFLFWVLVYTFLCLPYMIWKLLSFGFLTGFLISAFSLNYGIKGLLLVLIYNFPQGLIYFPLYVILLIKGYNMNTRLRKESRYSSAGRREVFISSIPMIIISLVLLILGCFLEAFINSYMVKGIVKLF